MARGDRFHELDQIFERQLRRIRRELYPSEEFRQARRQRLVAGDDLDFVVTELSDHADCVTVRR